ncbi:chaperonin 10-like protein [Fusarium tricinctum]|uniref:Chaperonin 10-like protein n=1 Tax=Fusarium tricinctum TaxID=61284 RepID=A0A8K0RZG4_9HYPO|nr:chaperonin 10-like protein [Fusarium tricinctum]
MTALKLVKFNKNYQLQTDVKVPIPGPNEVLVRVSAASYCHTDYQVYEGVFSTQLPVTPSHEASGTVVSLGSQVSDEWNVGDRVGVINFRNPCNACGGCKWSTMINGALDARYCSNRSMCGITGSDGAFAEYMITPHSSLVRLPAGLSFEQAAPLMCAGATAWNAVNVLGAKKGHTIAILGIGGLGVLAMQFAKARGYYVIAIDNHTTGLERAAQVPLHLRPDLIVDYSSSDATQVIDQFTDGLGVHGAIGCTEDIPANDWILHQLQPRGTCVILGHPLDALRIDAMNLIFREVIIKGAVYCPTVEVERMVQAVVKHGIVSELSFIRLEEGETIPEKIARGAFDGRLVVQV